MLRACLKSGLILDKNNKIISILDKSSHSFLSLTDILVLTRALHGVMTDNTTHTGSNSTHTQTHTHRDESTPLFFGKHLLVSLGSRGVLWCGPNLNKNINRNLNKKTLDSNSISNFEIEKNEKNNCTGSVRAYREISGEFREEIVWNKNENRNENINDNENLNGINNEIDVNTEIKCSYQNGFDCTASWVHVPAIPLDVSTDSTCVLNTNGAGDSFCGGFIHSLIFYQKNKDEDKFLNMFLNGDKDETEDDREESREKIRIEQEKQFRESLNYGLLAARTRILSSKK